MIRVRDPQLRLSARPRKGGIQTPLTAERVTVVINETMTACGMAISHAARPIRARGSHASALGPEGAALDAARLLTCPYGSHKDSVLMRTSITSFLL